MLHTGDKDGLALCGVYRLARGRTLNSYKKRVIGILSKPKEVQDAVTAHNAST